MTPSDLPIPYPPPPWRSRGTIWTGLLSTRGTLDIPMGFRPLLGSRRLVLMLVRYLGGTLCYDEFLLGSPVRRGVRAGLWVHHIWVNDAASMWGGRCIWGVPKESAEFSWKEHGVEVSGPGGLVVNLYLPPAARSWLPLPLAAPAFGRIGDRYQYFVGRLHGRVSPASVHVGHWPTGLPPLVGNTSRLGLRVDGFRMVLGAPRALPLDEKDRR
jgi:hypothetical protein